MRELTYFVASTIDGFIAMPDGDFSAFPMTGDHMAALVGEYADTLPGPASTALGVRPDRARFDTVLMGWETYAVGLASGLLSPYPHLRQIVFSRTERARHDDVEVTDADPVTTVRTLKAEEGTGIWLCGGGTLAAVVENEIDELVVKLTPLTLGSGKPLFTRAAAARPWILTASRPFDSGVIWLTYRQT